MIFVIFEEVLVCLIEFVEVIVVIVKGDGLCIVFVIWLDFEMVCKIKCWCCLFFFLEVLRVEEVMIWWLLIEDLEVCWVL